MIVDYTRYDTNDIIKVQAFVRGCLCRDRVVKMVEKWIDEMKLHRPGMTTVGQSSISGSAQMVINPLENSVRSMSSVEIKPNEMGESAHGSVSSIRSIFESKKDPNAPVPTRSWSKRELEVGEHREENQGEKGEDEQPISQLESEKEEEKDQELSAAKNQKTNAYVKNLKLQSNATKNVSSSEKVLEEQEVIICNSCVVTWAFTPLVQII